MTCYNYVPIEPPSVGAGYDMCDNVCHQKVKTLQLILLINQPVSY